MKIFEVSQINFTDEVISVHSGQVDSRLSLIYDGETVGYVDYSIYEGEPSINMIEVFHKGNRYGTHLIKKLQSMYPEQELNWGVTTEEGEALRTSLKYKKIDTEFADDFKRLEFVSQEIKNLMAQAEELWDKDTLTDKEKATLKDIGNKLNDLNDEQYDLESMLYNKKAHKYIIDYRN